MSEKLGPYTLERLIGSGGMADVFLARGPRGVCVVKRPHAVLCAKPDFVRMFLDEASLLAQLHHPGIAQIFDLGEVRGVYYLAMEYVPGFDLMAISLEYERHGELIAPELCARIVADAGLALHSAHEAHGPAGQPLHLVHRDVSPHNILLSTRGEVKVIDFGVARSATTSHRTQAGYVKGKYPYMSPEQIVGGTIDRRVDVYALGLVLYELLTNARAIAGHTEVEQIDNARSGRIRPIEQLRPNTPVPLRQIIASCLYPDPEGRYPTALALSADLEKYLAFERHVVGQEDLLRLFRVVAAEAQPESVTLPVLPESGAEVWLHARSTEQERPLTAMVLPEGGAQTLPSDERLGSLADTSPSLPPVRPDLSQATTAKQAVLRPSRKLPSRAWWLFAFIAATAVVLVVSAWRSPTAPIAAVPDAGVAPIAPPLRFVFPEDAGLEVEPEAALAADPGAPADSPFVDAGALGSLASLRVTCEPVADVFIDKQPVGRTPVTAEVAVGAHQVLLVNRAEGFSRALVVSVEAGEQKTVGIVAHRGVLLVEPNPFAALQIKGLRAAEKRSASARHELDLWEGSYQLDLELTAVDLASPVHKSVRVQVKPGVTTRVGVNMLE